MENIISRLKCKKQNKKPVLTGPFPVCTDLTPPFSKTGDLLTDFVNFIAVKAEIHSSGKYTKAQLQKHTDYVERFIQDLCADVGAKEPAFIVKEIARRGSHYEKTKVVAADECDFLIILALSDDADVLVEDLGEECEEFYDDGYGVVTVRPGSLLSKLPRDTFRTYTEGRYLLLCSFIKKLNLEVKCSLESRLGSKFKGYVDFHESTTQDTLTEGECTMHASIHGPSIWLRLGTRLSTTDIDLCFCIERSGSYPRSVMVAERTDIETKDEDYRCECIADSGHWINSAMDPPDDDKHILNKRHKQLFICLKLINHISGVIMDGNISSYALKCLILKHQMRCKSTSVGECLEAIVRDICGQKRDRDFDPDTFDITLKECDEVYDVNYPRRRIYRPRPYKIPVFVWFLQHVKYTTDTEWWYQLLDEQFPDNIPDGGIFQPLIKRAKELNELKRLWSRHSFAQPQPILINLQFEWVHDNRITRLSITE